MVTTFFQCSLALIVAAVGVYYYHTPMALVIAELLKRMVKQMGVSSISDILTPDLLKCKDEEGDTLVHLAATIACFDELRSFLTPDILMIQNDGGSI